MNIIRSSIYKNLFHLRNSVLHTRIEIYLIQIVLSRNLLRLLQKARQKGNVWSQYGPDDDSQTRRDGCRPGAGCVAAAPSRAIDERDVGYCIPSYRASQPTPTTTTKYQHKYKCMHETNIGSVYLCIWQLCVTCHRICILKQACYAWVTCGGWCRYPVVIEISECWTWKWQS